MPTDPWARYAGTGQGSAMPPGGFCFQVGGQGSGNGFGTVPVSPGDATRVRVPSSPGDSSSNGRPVAKARGGGPVLSAPFVQGTFVQPPVPGSSGNQDSMNAMMSQMNQLMQSMSSFQSEVSNRLAVLESRENVQQSVLSGAGNPQNFGESYGSGQGGSFNRLGSPIREVRSSRDEVHVFLN